VGPTGPSGPSGPSGPQGPDTCSCEFTQDDFDTFYDGDFYDLQQDVSAIQSWRCAPGSWGLSGGTNDENLDESADNYASLIAQTSPSATSTDNRSTVFCGGALSDFQVTLSGPPGGGNSYELTVMVDEASIGLSCTVAGASATTCTTAGPVNVPPGMINVRVVPISRPDVQSADWTATFSIPSSGSPIQ